MLLSNVGKDATEKFLKIHPDGLGTIDRFLPPVVLIGRLAQNEKDIEDDRVVLARPTGPAVGYMA